MKKLLTILTAAALLLGCLALPAAAAESGFANFQKTAEYAAGQFPDVAEGEWYTESVAAVYELGLMKGNADGSFNVTGSISLAETVTLAARLHSIYYTGAAEFSAGDPWYRPYADYALKNGLLSADCADYAAAATRSEFAAMLSRALPASALPEINTVAENQLPDVKASSENAAEIYQLYRAGILAGNDSHGTFTPAAPIQRAAVAAIVARMAYRSLRLTFSLEALTYPDLMLREKTDDSFFDDAAMVGNSLVQGMRLYSGLNNIDYYCYPGVSVNTVESYVTELCKKQYGKVYIELGINEIGLAPETFAAAYGKSIDRIREAMPDADIYIMAVTPVTQAKSNEGTFTMKRITGFNEALRALAAEKECWFLDCCTPLCDETGYLKSIYSGWDGSPHLSVQGYKDWADVMRTYYA